MNNLRDNFKIQLCYLYWKKIVMLFYPIALRKNKQYSRIKSELYSWIKIKTITSPTDDEPETGPDHYVLVVGFYRAEMLSLLEHMGVQLNGVMQVRSGSYEDFNKLVNSPKPPILLMQEPQLSEEGQLLIA